MSSPHVKKRIVIRSKEEGHEVLCRIPNDMSDQGHLTEVTFQRNDRIQSQIILGRNVSRNPVVGTYYGKLEPGDIIRVSWHDIKGRTGSLFRKFDGKAD